MAGPKGVRRIAVASGNVHLFSDTKRIVIQLRMKGDDENPCSPWAKLGVELTAAEALNLAAELLHAVAASQLLHSPTASDSAGDSSTTVISDSRSTNTPILRNF